MVRLNWNSVHGRRTTEGAPTFTNVAFFIAWIGVQMFRASPLAGQLAR